MVLGLGEYTVCVERAVAILFTSKVHLPEHCT